MYIYSDIYTYRYPFSRIQSIILALTLQAQFYFWNDAYRFLEKRSSNTSVANVQKSVLIGFDLFILKVSLILVNISATERTF